ncbi:MAG TPA: hypothetical protein VMU94_21375 [Streptosporangiaceae bacterium]|nr:hypothetical protein [Streptosporangiaceae bacterium]
MTAEPAATDRPLLAIAHLSDTHVMDHQSPGRAELFDRFSDEDSPLRSAVGIIGCYRAQELFTFQVADAMVRAIRRAAEDEVRLPRGAGGAGRRPAAVPCRRPTWTPPGPCTGSTPLARTRWRNSVTAPPSR